MNYINYFIKCVIRKIVNLIFKPKKFLLLLVVGFVFSAFLCNTTFASTGEGETIIPTILSDYTLDTSTDKIVTFGGFNLYYIKVSEGQNFSWEFTTNSSVELRIGYTKQLPDTGVNVSNLYVETEPDGFISSERIMTSPVNGYFCLAVYPKSGFNTIVFRDYTTNSDALNNLGNTLIDNQDKNTDKILNSDVSDNSINVDTNDFVVDTQETVALDNFFTSFMNTIKDIFINIDNSVEEIEIGIPFTRSINYFTK